MLQGRPRHRGLFKGDYQACRGPVSGRVVDLLRDDPDKGELHLWWPLRVCRLENKVTGGSDGVGHSRTTACHDRGRLTWGIQGRRFEAFQTGNGERATFGDDTVGSWLTVDEEGVINRLVAGLSLIHI